MVFYPENMKIQNTERNFAKLEEACDLGMAQTKREWDSWMEFLEK